MRRKWQVVLPVIILAMITTAVIQELSKPSGERNWSGKVLGLVPYNFRLPRLERFKETYWSPYDRRVMVPAVFGIGWAVNFRTLFEKIGLIKEYNITEEHFLMPHPSLKKVLKHGLPLT